MTRREAKRRICEHWGEFMWQDEVAWDAFPDVRALYPELLANPDCDHHRAHARGRLSLCAANRGERGALSLLLDGRLSVVTEDVP